MCHVACSVFQPRDFSFVRTYTVWRAWGLTSRVRSRIRSGIHYGVDSRVCLCRAPRLLVPFPPFPRSCLSWRFCKIIALMHDTHFHYHFWQYQTSINGSSQWFLWSGWFQKKWIRAVEKWQKMKFATGWNLCFHVDVHTSTFRKNTNIP